jgi:hypothetical protein
VTAPQRPLAQPHQRHAPQHFDARAPIGAAQLEVARHHEHLHVEADATAHDAHHVRVRLAAECEDDVVRVEIAEDLG